MDAQSRRATVDSTDRGPRQATPSTGEHPANAAQRRANDRVWAGGRHVGTYANRRLRPVEIEILPSSTSFEPGESLRVVIGGGDIYSNAMLHHRERCNQGNHTLHLGGQYDSGLLVPFVPSGTPK